MGDLCRRLLLCLAAITAGCASPDAPPPAAYAESPVPGTIGVVVTSTPAGIVVAAIGKQSPAAASGLRVGDVVRRYNGVSVAEAEQFYRLMLDSSPGGTVVVEVLRDGLPHRFEVPVYEVDTASRA